MNISYCAKCLYPSTKPSLSFDENNICAACNSYSARELYFSSQSIDQRYERLYQAVKSRTINSDYDCIIPVSGGKDSTYQVWRVLQAGLKPLCVTAPTDWLTPLGRQNLNNIKSLSVDHVEFTVSSSIRKSISSFAFRSVGDIQWAEHILIFTIPVHAALMFQIPTIIWGENSAKEYGAGRDVDRDTGTLFTRRYLEENCGLNGLRVSDLVQIDGIGQRDLHLYSYPDPERVESLQLAGLFLDDYFPWNPVSNDIVARSLGFAVSESNIVGTLGNNENLDNYYHGIHDYLKYLKYGFGRATDVACNMIRRGILAREDAEILVAMTDGKYPSSYLDRSLSEILSHAGLTLDDFNNACDKFTNYDLFLVDSHGELIMKNGSPQLKQSRR